MRPNNPACYECPKSGVKALHTWKMRLDGTAWCLACKMNLNAVDAADMAHDSEAGKYR